MKKIISASIGLLFMVSANAGNSWSANCKIKDTSIRGLESVYIGGPMTDRHFRLRLMDATGKQFETAACDFSGECYEKDEYGYYHILSRMYVEVSKRTKTQLNLTVISSIRIGVAELKCSVSPR